jgi:amidophosphoribosyltransferase
MDKPKEECGVLGLWAETPLDVAGMLHLGLLALQHRGQEAAGIAVSDGKTFLVEKDLGLVNQVFTEERLARLRLPEARLGIAHTRYSTTGSNLRINAQPLTARTVHGVLAIAHNGNFVNAKPLRDRLLLEGATFQSTSDTEVMLLLIARLGHLPLEEAAAEAMKALEGGTPSSSWTAGPSWPCGTPTGCAPWSSARPPGATPSPPSPRPWRS